MIDQETNTTETEAAEEKLITSRDYDLTRQIGLLTLFGVGAAALMFVISIALATLYLFGTPNTDIVFTMGGLALALPGLAGLSIWLARNRHITIATLCLVVALAITNFVPHLIAIQTERPPLEIVLFFASYPLVILVSGVLTNRTMIIITTVAVNILSLVAITTLPSNSIQGEIYVAVTAQQLLTAGILLLFAGGYQQTLRKLDEAIGQYERARQLDELKEQFITSVNHELRNPVMAMLGYLELLKLPKNRESHDRLDLIVGEANKAGQNLRALLNSILETRRLDQGAENFIPQMVSVSDSVHDSIRMIDPREAALAGRDLRIRVPTNVTIWGDPILLQQIMTNLISNAIKYSGTESRVDITALQVVDLQEAKGRWGRKEPVSRLMVEILVRDYGLGVPPEQAQLLFQRFARLPRDLASNVVGNGLGLYLCRVFAEVMGGRIWLESAGVSGKGTTFHVRLPLPPGQEQATQANPEPASDSIPVTSQL